MKLFSIFEDKNGELLEVADKKARDEKVDINGGNVSKTIVNGYTDNIPEDWELPYDHLNVKLQQVFDWISASFERVRERFTHINQTLGEQADAGYLQKNLLKLSAETNTKSGVTLTNNNNGTYTISGTASAQVEFSLGYQLLKSGTYYLSGVQGGSGSTYFLRARASSTTYATNMSDTVQFTLNAETNIEFVIRVYSGQTVNTVIKPMITSGESSFDEFAQYAPSNIELAEETADINSNLDTLAYGEYAGGKNLSPINNNLPRTSTTTVFEDIKLARPIKAGTKFTVSWKANNISKVAQVYPKGVNGEDITYNKINENTKRETTFIFSVDIYYIGLFLTNVNEEPYDFMVEESATATDYEPYIMSNKQLTQQNDSLADYGIDEKSNRELIQGSYGSSCASVTSSPARVTTKEAINVNSGDTITIYASGANNFGVGVYDASNNRIEDSGWKSIDGKATYTVSHSGIFHVNLRKSGDANITPGNISKFAIYVNNSIEEIKADLGNSGLNIWKNKKCAFLGDSITYGVGTTTGNRYLDYMSKDLGITTYCYAQDGATSKTVLAQAQKMKSEIGNSVDSIFVLCGTNDFYSGNPLGKLYASAIDRFTLFDNVTWTAGGKSETGAQKSYDGWYNSNFIDVTGVKYIYINGHSYENGTTIVPPLLMYNSSKTLVKCYRKSDEIFKSTLFGGQGYDWFAEGVIKVPSNVKYIVVNKNTTTLETERCLKVGYNNGDYALNIDDTKWIAGGMNDSGVQQSYGGWYNSNYKDVSNCDWIYINAYQYKQGSVYLPPVMFFDADKKLINVYGKDYAGLSVDDISSTDSSCRGYVKVPSNASYCVVNYNEYYYSTTSYGTPGVNFVGRSKGQRIYPLSENTFASDYGKLLNYLKVNFPYSQIIAMTPIHRGNATFSGNTQPSELKPNSSGYMFDDYINTIKDACGLWSVQYIDLYNDSGLYPLDSSYSIYFNNSSTDMLHPNALGHRRISKVIESKLNAIIPSFRNM